MTIMTNRLVTCGPHRLISRLSVWGNGARNIVPLAVRTEVVYAVSIPKILSHNSTRVSTFMHHRIYVTLDSFV